MPWCQFISNTCSFFWIWVPQPECSGSTENNFIKEKWDIFPHKQFAFWVWVIIAVISHSYLSHNSEKSLSKQISYIIHITFTSHSHLIHTSITSQSYIMQITFTSHSHLIHTSFTPQSHLSHISGKSQSQLTYLKVTSHYYISHIWHPTRISVKSQTHLSKIFIKSQ